ncbi:MAG: zinc ABC transporter substrate-binding protein [Sphaerochaetaceae bacterium]|nr:zinc ABC transporter substrate-binding protein [Sphaerochaetaceae bacterium]
MIRNTYTHITVIAVLLVSLTLPLSGQGVKEQPEQPQLTVAVSILPHQAAVDRISGGLASSVVLVGPGQSPHAYEPTPRQMSELSQADLWLLSGTEFEHALEDKIAELYPDLNIIDGTEGVTFRTLEDHDHDEKEHDAEGPEEGRDQHTWLGREPYIQFIDHALQAMKRHDPANAAVYEQNAAAYLTEINESFESLRADLAYLEGETVLVFHPAFGYFLDEFGLDQEAIETGGKEPTARVLSSIINEAVEDGIKTVFVQEQFPTSAAESVADAIGGSVVALNPLAYDWLENIRRMGDALKDSL